MSKQLSAAASANMENARKADGKFGSQIHSVDPSIVLAPAIDQERLDSAGTDMLQRTAVNQAESRLFFRRKNVSPMFDRPIQSYEDDVELAADINLMVPERRAALLARLSMTRFAGLSEPGQALGNEAVTIPDGDYTDEELGMILATQDDFKLLDLDEPAVLVGFKKDTVFHHPIYNISRPGVTQKVEILQDQFRNLFLSSSESEDHLSNMWASRANVYGHSSTEDDPVNKRFKQVANFHLQQAVMADEASNNERLAPYYDTFKELSLDERRLKVEVDGQEMHIKFDGPTMQVLGSDRKPLAPMMADGFAKQFAKSIKYPRGAGAMKKDLASVFDNAAQRMPHTGKA